MNENESILKTIRAMLLSGESDITDFDTDLIVFINSSLNKLFQAGIKDGNKPFKISGDSETWEPIISKEEYLETIKEFIYLDVKIVFDPPTSSIVTDALKQKRDEDYWRITAQIDISTIKDDDEGSEKIVVDYNNQVINKPKLDGVELKGDVKMDLADKDYVNEQVGEIENGSY